MPLPRLSPAIKVFVAGFPAHSGCVLWAEFRRADGFVFRTDCRVSSPAERWTAWDIEAPSGTVAMRMVGENDTKVLPPNRSWIGISEPLMQKPAAAMAAVIEFTQVFAAFALVVTLIWLPGLILARRVARPEIKVVVLLGSGPLALVLIGMAAWVTGGAIRPAIGGAGLVVFWWALLGTVLWRRKFASDLSPNAFRALGISVLCAMAATARAADSDGPEGELYGGLISRTLAVGDRSDSRISYFIPQIVHRHLSPFSAEAERHFTPWTFFSRGPLAGLVATPVVFATGGRPAAPIYSPAETTAFYRWHRFDSAGFAAYRIVLMALASMVFFALFAVLARITGEPWALVACGFLALCPFGMHEVMFTWPKWEATTWMLVSFLFAQNRAPVFAGFSLAVAFLFHPLAALRTPWLGLWAVGRAWPNKRAAVLAAALFTTAVAIIVLPWMALGRFPAQLAETTRAGRAASSIFFSWRTVREPLGRHGGKPAG